MAAALALASIHEKRQKINSAGANKKKSTATNDKTNDRNKNYKQQTGIFVVEVQFGLLYFVYVIILYKLLL